MECFFDINYSYGDPNKEFDCGRKVSREEYVRTMVSTYNKYKPVIDRNIHRFGYNMAINNEGPKEKNEYRKQAEFTQKTKAVVRDVSGNDMFLFDFQRLASSGEMFLAVVVLPQYAQDEIAEGEVKSWMRETSKINVADLSDEDRLRGYTPRNFVLTTTDGATRILLRNAKIVRVLNKNSFVVLVGRAAVEHA